MTKKLQRGEVTPLAHKFADWGGFVRHDTHATAKKQSDEILQESLQPQDWTNDGWPCTVQSW